MDISPFDVKQPEQIEFTDGAMRYVERYTIFGHFNNCLQRHPLPFKCKVTPRLGVAFNELL